jgi:hypothetical protein
MRNSHRRHQKVRMSIKPLRRMPKVILCLGFLLWIFSGNALAEEIEQLTEIDVEFLEGGLKLSPDGSRIGMCYRFYEGDVGRMAWMYSDEPGVPLNVLYSNFPDSGVHSFCWEPDGQGFLMSMKSTQILNPDLYRGSLYGGQLERITYTPGRAEYWPQYSNGGEWLAYAAVEYGTYEMDVVLRNMQTQWDSVVCRRLGDQNDFSWVYNDTAFFFEGPIYSEQRVHLFYNPPYGQIEEWFVGEDICCAPQGISFVFNIVNDSLSSDILCCYPEDPIHGHFYFYNITSRPELFGMKSDPEWYPSTEENTFIFLKKHLDGEVWKGDIWKISNVVLPVPESPEVVPFRYSLGQPFPNPFNSCVTIPLELSGIMPVRWEMYNTLGQRVLQVSPETLTTGLHRIIIDGDDLASGSYWILVHLGRQTEARKLVLMK